MAERQCGYIELLWCSRRLDSTVQLQLLNVLKQVIPSVKCGKKSTLWRLICKCHDCTNSTWLAWLGKLAVPYLVVVVVVGGEFVIILCAPPITYSRYSY